MESLQSTRDLLEKANAIIKTKHSNEPEERQGYAFADINCNLRMRLPGAENNFVYFNNECDVVNILSS